MSSFADKVFAGKATTPLEWEEYLLRAHRAAPGMSSAAFANCRNQNGKNSYEWLAESVSENKDIRQIVDLACGEGYLLEILKPQFPTVSLVGIDMSESELELARLKPWGDKVSFCLTKAHDTKLETSSVDAVLCHMAFMLMLPVEPVAKEIIRVLKPGGVFAGVIGSNRKEGKVSSVIWKTVGEFLNVQFPKRVKPVTGDQRAQTKEGLREILGAFKQIEFFEDTFVERVNPAGAWEPIKNMYLIGSLPAEVKARLKERVISAVAKEHQEGEKVGFDFAMLKFVAVK